MRTLFPEGQWKMDPVRIILSYAIISCALSFMFYQQVKTIAPMHVQNYETFLAHKLEIQFFTISSDYFGKIDLQKAWKPRVLSNVLGSLITAASVKDDRIDWEVFSGRVALWSVLWFGSLLILYIIFFRYQAILLIMGTYCGVAYGYMIGMETRVYPWDMPALFFFGLFTCFLSKDKIIRYLPFLPVAVLFKETVIITAAAYLVLEKPLRRGAWLFFTAVLLTAIPRQIADIIFHTSGRFTINTTLIASNIKFLSAHPVVTFINAGLLASCIVLPFGPRHRRAINIMCGLFLSGVILFAVAYEYRLWFEMIPFGLYKLSAAAFRKSETGATAA